MRKLLLHTSFTLLSTAIPSIAAPVITEFMASGSEAPVAADGSTPDWIEIHNPDEVTVNLEGYALSDDAEQVQKWLLPSVSLEPGGYLIVFASGDDVREGNEWHTNFQLDGGGEYLTFADASGTLLSEFTFPEQRGNVSYGDYEGALHFFNDPSPGEANGEGIVGFVADTKFSVNRGYYDEGFTLEITTATEGADIFYSVDGSDPAFGTLFNPAKKYTEPLTIDTTTVVRAMAKKAGWQSTNTDTHTYIFHNDVVDQPEDPDGFPDRWGSFRVDYEMDPEITGPNATEMTPSLRSLPTVSFVGETDDFFGSRGIYANPESKGVEWEVPISFEWIDEDGTERFQVDCGARIQGGFFRQASATEKHSFRLLFKGEYGVERLREDIVDLPGATSNFDTIVFRAGANDGYAWGAAGTTVQFLRDEFGRRLAHAAGHYSPRGGFNHLYINGLYWGVYNLTERPNEDFSSTYYGGDADDWDSVNSGEVKNAGGRENGNDPTNSGLRDWNAYISAARSASTYEDWMALQGLNPDGTRNPDLKVYLDADHYVDYMIINYWGGNWDWPNKNFWFGRLNTPESTGFKHYVWDFENTMGNNRDRSPLNMRAPRNTQWVGEPWAALRDLLWFQVKWADRTQRLFFNDGPLAPDQTIARYSAMADELEPAIYAETARWGDDNSGRPHTIDEWRGERDWMLNTYLPQRTDIVLDQFVDYDVYPERAAVVFSQHGGVVANGFELAFEGSTANAYYTTDGTDPFQFNETSGDIELSPTATPYENPIPITGTTTVKARYFSRSIFGSVSWSALTEATFSLGTDGLVVAELMYHPPAPTDEEREQGWTSASQFEYLRIQNIGSAVADLEGVRFDAGVQFAFTEGQLEAGESLYLVRDLAAFESRYGTGHAVLGAYGGRLDDGGETIRLVDASGNVIHAFRYEDDEPWPMEADGEGKTLVLKPGGDKNESSKGDSWSAGDALVGEGGNGGGGDGETFDEWMTTNGLSAPDGDDDGDGIPNLLEFVYGSEPTVAEHQVGPSINLESQISSPLYVYPRRMELSGVDVNLEWSADLVTWSPVTEANWVVTETPVATLPGVEAVGVAPKEVTSQPRFLRLSATR